MKAPQMLESRRKQSGMTLIEALVAVAALSTLATVAFTVITLSMPISIESKLNRQVAVLNASATIYRLNGGQIDPLASTAEVFTKLQLAASDGESSQLVGFSGSTVDPNLQFVLTSPAQVGDPTVPRIVWNPNTYKFALTHGNKPGITSFKLDSKGASTRVVHTESRLKGGAVTYNSNGGWIWGYNETPRKNVGPTYISGTPTRQNTPPPPPVPSGNTLSPPLISTPEGVYPITQYQLSVTLANPNPSGSSDIYYTVNHGPSRLYRGEVLTFAPNQFVAAISEPRSEDWKPSIYRVAYYKASPVKLQAPIIRTSAPQFSFDKGADIHVSLNNPNQPSVSRIEYRIAGGGWKNYKNRSIKLRESDYRDGSLIEARALPTTEYYLTSDTSSRQISPAVATTLRPPVIVFSSPDFSDKINKIEVTLINQNPKGSSEIYYAITDPEATRDESEPLVFKKYKKAFDRKQKDHKHGFAIVAYARATSRAYRDSADAEGEVGDGKKPHTPDPENPVGLLGGHFDLDTSSFIAEFHSGTTDAHVHEYDKKFGVLGADFFNLKGGTLHHLSDDVSNCHQFKLIIVNPALSPGGRLVINNSYDDEDPSTWIPVQDYAAIPLEDLPTFSLNGTPGTVHLTQLGLYFDVDAIANHEIIPTNTGDVRANVPGKNGEWRNGALAIQAVRVKPGNKPDFDTSLAVSNGGNHGGATRGLLWEATFFWHWDGPSYHESGNPYTSDAPALITRHAD